MATNVTTLGDLLVNVYDKDTVTTLQNLSAPFLAYIGEASDYQVGGKGMFFAVNSSGDEAYGFIGEEQALPQPQNEQTKQAVVNPKIFVGATRISGLGRAISMRDPFAFANGLQNAMDYKLKRMVRYLETAMFRDGTGSLALVNGSPGADTTTTFVNVDTPGSQWLRRNMMVDFFRGTTKVAGPIQVGEVDLITGTGRFLTSTVNLNGVILDNDIMYNAALQQHGVAAAANEILGLPAALGATTGSYLGISRTAVPEWQPNRVDAAGANLTEDLLLRAENRVMIVGGVEMSAIKDFRLVMHPNQRRKYFALVVPQKQFTGLALDAGYSKLTWNGHEFVETYNCPRTTVYMGDFGALNKYTAPDGELKIDTSFGPPIKWAQGYDAGLAYWRAYCNYALKKPNAWVELHTLADVAAM